MNSIKNWLFIIIFQLIIASGLIAQDTSAYSYSLESPHNTIFTHLFYLQPEQYSPETAAMSFYNNISLEVAGKRAIQLKQVLDGKGLRVLMSRIPTNPNYIDSLSGNQIYILFPIEYPEIYVEKAGDRWYYSQETISAIPKIHKKMYALGLDKLLNILPNASHNQVLGLDVWQWIGLLMLILFSLLIHVVLWRLLNFMLTQLSFIRNRMNEKLRPEIVGLARIFSVLIMISVFKMVMPVLQLPINISEVTIIGISIVQTVFVVLLLIKTLKILSFLLQSLTEKTESKMDDQLLPILMKIAQILIVIIGVFQILNLLSVNVAALIAGISIGGLALALAAQDTVKNLIGSVMIFVDKPFQIGDYIVSGDIEGTVEEVGFRSTRIRKIDTSVLAVPNGNISNLALTNLGIRNFRMMKANLGILYNTPTTKIQEFLDGLKQIIVEHPKIFKETYYVHLTELQDSSLNIMFRIYLITDAYNEELVFKEEVLFSILQLAEKIGVSFAYPSTSVYIEKSD